MDIPVHRRRRITLAALEAYEDLLKKAKKAEETAGVPTSATDELLGYVAWLKEENVDMTAVNRDALLDGTPMGDAIEHFPDDDGVDLTADMLDRWLQKTVRCVVPYPELVSWNLQNRKWVSAWLRAIDSDTAERMKADTTLTADMALDLPHAISCAPAFIHQGWFRQPIPLEALTDEGITGALASIGCMVPPEVVITWNAETRESLYRYVQDAAANRPVVRPKVIDLAWFSSDLRAAIEAGEALAIEEAEQRVKDAALGDAGDFKPEVEEEPMDGAVLEGWLLAGPWNVRVAKDEQNQPTEDFEVFWNGPVVDGQEHLHPFVYPIDAAQQTAAQLNRASKRAADEEAASAALESAPALTEEDGEPAGDGGDGEAPTGTEGTKRRRRKKT